MMDDDDQRPLLETSAAADLPFVLRKVALISAERDTSNPEGRAVVRISKPPFSFPAVAVEDDVIAFLESETGGNNCDVNADDCNPNPCQNGGTCTDDVGGYICTCQPGFTGTDCEINIDDCSPNPCLNGGTCVDGVDSYFCSCAAGFTGTNCDQNPWTFQSPNSKMPVNPSQLRMVLAQGRGLTSRCLPKSSDWRPTRSVAAPLSSSQGTRRSMNALWGSIVSTSSVRRPPGRSRSVT